MNSLNSQGWRGADVDHALLFDSSTVAITFDDGSETDLLIAAPVLREFGFGATFYVTTGFLGRPGYLTVAQLQGLASMGFQIGCHSMTHAYLSDLDDEGLRREIVDSKMQLEQIVGKRVEHFSCPGGRYNVRSVQIVKTAGYRTMSTSHCVANFAGTDVFALGRIPVMRETTLRTFDARSHGHGLWSLRIRESFQQLGKRMLGNTVYDRLRDAVLNK
jgi:peptidoglycan/xylan/chitin deacetylase (PgdA/CDA1 family)